MTAMRGQKLAAFVCVFAALGLYGYCQVWRLAAPDAKSRDRQARGRIHTANDFKHLYFGAKILRLGASPYEPDYLLGMARESGVAINPYVYLPFTGQVLAPLASLPLRRAIEAWFVLNHVMTLLALALLALMWPRAYHIHAFLILVAGAALWYPLTRTLTAGQLNCALLLALAAYWLAVRHERHWIAGAALAFATLFKIAPAVLIFVLALQRRWRLLMTSGVWLCVMLSISAAICGPGRYLEFVPVAQDMGYGKSTWSEADFEFYRDPFNQSPNAFLHRAFANNPTVKPYLNLGPRFANTATWLVTLALLAAVSALIFLGRSQARTAGDDLDLALGILLMLLAPSLYWDHYGVLLALPFALILRHKPGPVTLVLTVLAMALTAAPQGFFMFNVARLLPGGAVWYSMQLWATLLLLGVAFTLRLRGEASVPVHRP